MKALLKEIIELDATRTGRCFDITVQFLIVISLISFSIETLPTLDASTRDALNFLEIVIVGIFTLEYLLRTFVADRPLKFITSFYGIIDLIAILPFYVATGLDLRAARSLRLFRLFRIFKLVRYSKAMRRLGFALRLAKEELVLFLCMALILLFLSAVGIYHFENTTQPDSFSSVFDSLWWAVETLTTVGYGDIHPVTPGGKIFTFFILMIGLGAIAVPSGILASALSEARKAEQD